MLPIERYIATGSAWAAAAEAPGVLLGAHAGQAANTLQVRVVVADDVIGERAHERQLVPAAHGGQLEAAEAHEAGRHAAHHRARLHPRVAAARTFERRKCWEYW